MLFVCYGGGWQDPALARIKFVCYVNTYMDSHDILPINTEFLESGGRRREAEGGGGRRREAEGGGGRRREAEGGGGRRRYFA